MVQKSWHDLIGFSTQNVSQECHQSISAVVSPGD